MLKKLSVIKLKLAEKKLHNIITLQTTTVKLEYIKIWMKNQGQWHKIERVDCYEMNYTFQNLLYWHEMKWIRMCFVLKWLQIACKFKTYIKYNFRLFYKWNKISGWYLLKQLQKKGHSDVDAQIMTSQN